MLSVRPSSVPTIQNLLKQNNIQVRIAIATSGTGRGNHWWTHVLCTVKLNSRLTLRTWMRFLSVSFSFTSTARSNNSKRSLAKTWAICLVLSLYNLNWRNSSDIKSVKERKRAAFESKRFFRELWCPSHLQRNDWSSICSLISLKRYSYMLSKVSLSDLPSADIETVEAR